MRHGVTYHTTDRAGKPKEKGGLKTIRPLFAPLIQEVESRLRYLRFEPFCSIRSSAAMRAFSSTIS